MVRRGSGEGTVFRRKDGRWVAKVTVGRIKTQSAYAKTRREAVAKLDELRAKASAGVLAGSSSQTVGERLSHWLEHSVKPNRRASTHTDYEAAVRLHITPDPTATVPLSKLDAAHIEKRLGRLRAAKKGSRTVEKAHAVLRRSLNVAMKRKLVA